MQKNKKTFNTGDVVCLNVHKPKMMVRHQEGKRVECDWFENNQLHRRSFEPDDLTIVS
jgi:uncharacterized protein YodC (DUF2158 family)